MEYRWSIFGLKRELLGRNYGCAFVLVFIRNVQKRARKIPHDQGNSLVVWENHINYAKRKTRIELVRMVFYFI